MQLMNSRTSVSLAERQSSSRCAAAPTPRAGSRLCRAGAHKFPGFLGKIVSSGGKGKDSKHTGHGAHGQDDPSGMWQSRDHHWHDDVSETPHVDGPAADYLALHPPPVEDDPYHPDLPVGADAATAAAVLGPDMHGSLDPRIHGGGGGGVRTTAYGSGSGAGAAPMRFVINAAGAGVGAGAGGVWTGGDTAAARHAAMLAQLRERALEGSSDEDESWRRMDIPGLLLSPHHAAAMQSLSSASDSDDGLDGAGSGTSTDTRRGAWGGMLAPDFADLNLAREADAAAAAAAELVPPELRPLARAANILGVHGAARRGGGAAGAGGAGDSAASGEASGSEALEDLTLLEANRFAGLPEEPLTPQQLEAAAALLLGNNISPAAGLHASWCAAAGSSSVSTGSDADADTSSDVERGWSAAAATAAVAAAAAAAANGGGDVALIGGNSVAQSARQPRGGGSSSSSTSTSSARAAAVAAVSEEGIDWLGGPAGGGGGGSGEESRSVQLRRSPSRVGPEAAAAAGQLDAATRRRVAAAMADDVADAHAHVVRGHHGSSASPSAEEKRQQQQQQQQRYSLTRGVAGAAGQLAADAAAAAVAAEARRAVWGEAGWPYDAAVRSTDVVEDLKHEIREQREAAEHGGAVGGAAAGAPLGLP